MKKIGLLFTISFMLHLTVMAQCPSLISSNTNISCTGTCDGMITITPQGGMPPYTYKWGWPISNHTDSIATGLCEGSYQVTVTDYNNCPDSLLFWISSPTTFRTNLYTTSGSYCEADAPAYLSPAFFGGIWSGNGVSVIGNGYYATGYFSPSTAGVGTHTIYYSYSDTCGDRDSISLVVNPSFDATIIPAGPFCTSDAPVQLTSVDAGGIWYGVGLTIPSPSGIFSPSTAGAGTHTITYTISSGACGDTGTTNIVVLDCNDVWPGDANSDGVANNFDLLPIGIGYGATGAVRPNATINWTAQPATDWTDSLTSGVNYKHIDCNGDGTINDNDTTAIIQNYGKIHYKFSGTNKTTMAPLLYFDFSEDTILAGSTLAVPLMFGTSSIPATNFYGMAFTVGYNPAMVDSAKGVYMSFDNSWLGTIGSNMISIQKNFHSNGELEIGVTKINHSNVASGFGQIGTMYIVMEDNLSGKKNQLETFSLSLSNVKVISNDESIVSIDLGDDSVVVQSTGINELNALEKYFSVYPVPASDKLYIEYSNIQIDKIELLNMAGQNVFLINAVDRQKLSINTSNLPQGIYLLKIETDKGMYSKKINIK